ncbi:MAG: hypothetical protein K6E30_09210 [Lachnospiraceae bacterium]|nr:hypothetical protein [Lachnospiraceae bacterium]
MKRGAVKRDGGPYAAWMGSDGFYLEGNAIRHADEVFPEKEKKQLAARKKKKLQLERKAAAAAARRDAVLLAAACFLCLAAALFFLTMKHMESAQEEKMRNLKTQITVCANRNEAAAGELLLQAELSGLSRMVDKENDKT